MVHDTAGTLTRHDCPPGNTIAWYDEMGNDPAEAGAVHDNTADPSPATPLTDPGAEGGNTGGGNHGDGGAALAVDDPDVPAEPSAYPDRVAVTVTVDDWPADSPFTVTTPLPSIDAEPGEADAAQVHDSSKFVTCTVKPELEDTGEANTGTNAALRDAAPVLAVPSAYPDRVAVTVTVDDWPADSPATVTTPLPSIDAEPGEADAAQVHESSKFVTCTVKPELVDTGEETDGINCPKTVTAACCCPALIPVTDLPDITPKVVTGTGTFLSTPEPSPSWPSSLLPQQNGAPRLSNAHVE